MRNSLWLPIISTDSALKMREFVNPENIKSKIQKFLKRLGSVKPRKSTNFSEPQKPVKQRKSFKPHKRSILKIFQNQYRFKKRINCPITEEATRRPGFPDKLSTISCLLKYKFPFNEPPKPGLWVAEVMA